MYSSKFLVTERPYVSPSCVHFVYRRTSENPILVDMTDRNCVCYEKLIKNDHTLLIKYLLGHVFAYLLYWIDC